MPIIFHRQSIFPFIFQGGAQAWTLLSVWVAELVVYNFKQLIFINIDIFDHLLSFVSTPFIIVFLFADAYIRNMRVYTKTR